MRKRKINLNEYQILDLLEVAQVLKISKKTAGALLADGELEGRKVGREWRVSSEAIKEYMGMKYG